jgi:hypothetical protein
MEPFINRFASSITMLAAFTHSAKPTAFLAKVHLASPTSLALLSSL